MQWEGMLAAKEASVLLPASTHQFGSVSRRFGPGDWDLLRRHDMLKESSFSSADFDGICDLACNGSTQ
jgi:hypothetical protein